MRSRTDTILFTAIAGFGIGVFSESFLPVSFYICSLLLIVSVLVFMSVRFLPKFRAKALFIGIFLFAALGGVARYAISDTQHGDPMLLGSIGERVHVGGVISEEPDEREKTTLLTVNIKTFIH